MDRQEADIPLAGIVDEAEAPRTALRNAITAADEAHPSDSALRDTLGSIDKQYIPLPDVPKRIFVIGMGNVGKLVAHSLRSIPDPPPVTLILHRASLWEAWRSGKEKITLQDGNTIDEKSGFQSELSIGVSRAHGVAMPELSEEVYQSAEDYEMKPHEVVKILAERQRREEEEGTTPLRRTQQDPTTMTKRQRAIAQAYSDEPIDNLIVTTKALATVSALLGVKHRLNKDSTICFLQNGMGIIDEVNRLVFPDITTRPNYVQGIVTHGVNSPPEKREADPFYAVHAGHGTIALTALPREAPSTRVGADPRPDVGDESTPETARYLLRSLTRCPALCAVTYTPIELFQQQLEKLAVNCVINPITSLLDNRNGAVNYNFFLTRAMRIMLAEISLVIRSLPELKGIPNAEFRFSPERLESVVVGVANKTANNISSMLADVRQGHETEVKFINGYVVKRGEELGIKCVVNYTIMQLVMGKQLMTRRELQDEVPVAMPDSVADPDD